MNTVGERIRMIRNNLSRQAFADKYGVHRNTLERWEKNLRQPDEGFLSALVAGENITQKWLLFGEGPLHPESPSETLDAVTPPTCRRLKNCNTLNNNTLEKSETPTVGGFSPAELSGLQRELREQDKEIRDLMRENATILRENGDLRVDLERKKARIAELERELARLLKGDETPPVAEVG